MALIDQFAVAEDAAFRKRVELAIVQAAIAIVNEDPNTAAHGARVVLAYQVLGSPAQYAATMAVGVAADGAITLGSTDSVIQTRVAAIWTAYASRR